MAISKQDKDLLNQIKTVRYGNMKFEVERERGKTKRITIQSEETLRYVDNTEATRDILQMVAQLTGSGFTGEHHVKLSMKDGDIQLISIYNLEETTY